MHDDGRDEPVAADAWPTYLAALQGSGRFDGGSAIGAGFPGRNPVFEAGGTVEIRELPGD